MLGGASQIVSMNRVKCNRKQDFLVLVGKPSSALRGNSLLGYDGRRWAAVHTHEDYFEDGALLLVRVEPLEGRRSEDGASLDVPPPPLRQRVRGKFQAAHGRNATPWLRAPRAIFLPRHEEGEVGAAPAVGEHVTALNVAVATRDVARRNEPAVRRARINAQRANPAGRRELPRKDAPVIRTAVRSRDRA